MLHLDRGYVSDWTAAATVAAAVLGAVYLVLYRLQTVRKRPDEPPVIASAIPYVGHVLGMATQGGRYIKRIG